MNTFEHSCETIHIPLEFALQMCEIIITIQDKKEVHGCLSYAYLLLISPWTDIILKFPWEKVFYSKA